MDRDVGLRKTVYLGDEHNDELRDTLKEVLKELGGRAAMPSWTLGGSQELETVEVTVGDRNILVEAETYMGISITGDPDLVDEIAALVRARTASEPDPP